ncbi:hypothetical protein ES703_95836 [subsurface metagenome]
MGAIAIGPEAKDRSGDMQSKTFVCKDNPANASGKITTIEIWPYYAALENCKVATFHVIEGNILSTRDYVTLNAVPPGSKSTITEDKDGNPISLDVEEGDYIGIYFSDGRLEEDSAGFAGYWYTAPDQDLIPCTEHEFLWWANGALSLHGIGAELAAGGSRGYIIG